MEILLFDFYKVTKKEYKDYILVYMDGKTESDEKPWARRSVEDDVLITSRWFNSRNEAIQFINNAGGTVIDKDPETYTRKIKKTNVTVDFY